MTSTLLNTGFTSEAFESFLAARSEPAWLTSRRRAAFERFASQPLPSRREEEWMRTDIRALKLANFSPPIEPTAGELPPALLSAGVPLAGHAASLNSIDRPSALNPEWARKGVVFGSFADVLARHPEVIERHLYTVAPAGVDKLASLHEAFLAGGAVLYVPPGVTVEQPLHMLSALTAGQVDFSHTLVVLGEGAEATLLAETTGEAGSALHAGAVELIVGPEARLRYVNLQQWGMGTWHFAHQRATVDRGGQLQWTVGALGSRLAKVNQHVALIGEDARAQVNGVLFTEGKQHLSYHTLQHHQAPHCRSDLLYKGALQDEARVVWRGMIKVDPGAQKTDGYQRNDNLMLSTSARSDSIPGLEIEADDVRCTHGSTTGRVDEPTIFYARCRGLTRAEAVRMIVAGFFQQIFDRITIESVREALGEAISRRVRDYA